MLGLNKCSESWVCPWGSREGRGQTTRLPSIKCSHSRREVLTTCQAHTKGKSSYTSWKSPGRGAGDEDTSSEQPRLPVPPGSQLAPSVPPNKPATRQRQHSGHGPMIQDTHSSLFLPHWLILCFAFCLFFLFTHCHGAPIKQTG